MTARRRLDKLEHSLGSTEAILRWIEEAHRFPSVVEYARATIDLPDSAQPPIRITEQVAAAIRGARKARSDDELGLAVRRAIGDAVFLYQIVFILNQTAADFAQVAVLRSLVLVGQLDRLVTDPVSEEQDARRANLPAARQVDRAWQVWRESTEALVSEVRVEQAARSGLEKAYFAGGAVLFADVAEDWTRLGDQADRLNTIVTTLREPYRTRAGFRRRRILPKEPGSIASRAQSRKAELADDARIAAFEALGLRPRAIALAEARLRTS
jgi:hypothetical protein